MMFYMKLILENKTKNNMNSPYRSCIIDSICKDCFSSCSKGNYICENCPFYYKDRLKGLMK